MSNPDNVAGMARFGINPVGTLGVSVGELRKIAKEIPPSHSLALELWDTGIHEARILASIVDIPEHVSEGQMEHWAQSFDSWDICDQCCNNLFRKTSYAYPKAVSWTSRPEPFVKRAGFTLIACLAFHDKAAPDKRFEHDITLILREAEDDRNFVRKAVNWALRNIGKRNGNLHSLSLTAARELADRDSRTARWIGRDALRELNSEKVRKRLRS